MTLIHTTSDADLVAACLGGNRSAFEQIVERYQRLLCSLAYAALGDLRASEDAAQEAFLTAWLKLGELREPEKLRPWLCTILRHKTSHARRDARLEPVSHATELTADSELTATEISADEAAMNREEQSLVWGALQTLPPAYREPLVLFYREHNSIEHVAVELDLTEDTVKQRLSRGRKLLKEHVLALVERGLANSTPGRVFTVAVLASLPALAPPAKAAAMVTATTAASTATKSLGGLAKLTVIATLLASVTGAVSAVMSLRSSLDQARTDRERRAVVKLTIILFGSFVLFLAMIFAAQFVAARWLQYMTIIAVVHHVSVVLFAGWWSWMMIRELRLARELRTAERARQPDQFIHAVDQRGSKQSEYRSRAKLFGVPLVHIRFSTPDKDQGPAIGWIAGGDRAIGILVAWGGWAVGCVSIGAVTFGVFSFGAVSIGLLSIGAICFGGIALGAVSMGWHAFGSLSATALHSAQSMGMAFSNWVALGSVALAPHPNSELARRALTNPHADRDQLIFCVLIVLCGLVPTALYAHAVRKRVGPTARPPTTPR